MPPNALVIVQYGPYESCGVVQLATHRLEGLQALLSSKGHQCQLVPILDWNRVQLQVNGEMIFKCDICDLLFGGDGQLDPLCAEALQKVLEAY